MTTDDERRGLTEPLESVTTFFGALMIIAALIGVAFLVLAARAAPTAASPATYA